MEDEQSKVMQVTVLGLTGELCQLSLTSSWSARATKQAIQDLIDIPCHQQRLLAGNHLLKDTDLVWDYIHTDSESDCESEVYLTLVKRPEEQSRWIEVATRDWSKLLEGPPELWEDFDIVHAAVGRCGWALQHASPQLQDEPQVVLAAVQQNGLALQFASEALRSNWEVALAAAAQCGRALGFVGEELRAKKDFVLSVVRQNGRALEHCGVFRGDREVVMAAVEQSGYALASASTDLRADHDVVAMAAHQDRSVLVFAERRLRAQLSSELSDTNSECDGASDPECASSCGGTPMSKKGRLSRVHSQADTQAARPRCPSSTTFFGDHTTEGHGGLGKELGRTGALLCEMAHLGLPVVPGFRINEEVVANEHEDDEAEGSSDDHHDATDSSGTDGVAPNTGDLVKEAVSKLEQTVGQSLGSLVDPLLLSIRPEVDHTNCDDHLSNIGLTDTIADAWSRSARVNPRFVWDSYRRLIFNFARFVKQLDMDPFEKALDDVKQQLDSKCKIGRRHEDCDIPTNLLKELVEEFKVLFKDQCGEDFPQCPGQQLNQALKVVLHPPHPEAPCRFSSHGSPAAIVQAMSFGNYNCDSASGIARLVKVPGSKSTQLRGEWLANAQFEDLCTKRRVLLRLSVSESQEWASKEDISEEQRAAEFPSLEEKLPAAYSKLVQFQDVIASRLVETKSFEFSVQGGRLWIVQPHVHNIDMQIRHPKMSTSKCDSEDNSTNDVLLMADRLRSFQSTISTEDEYQTRMESKSTSVSSFDDIDDSFGEPVAPVVSLGAVAKGLTWSWCTTTWVPCEELLLLEAEAAEGDLAVAAEAAAADAAASSNEHQQQQQQKKHQHHHAVHRRGGVHFARRRHRRAATAPATSFQTAEPQLSEEATTAQAESWLKLPVWQTAVAGGLAGVATQAAAGNYAACPRGLPTGALCCTGYVNCLNMASEDGDLDSVPVQKRFACASLAASAAVSTMHFATSLVAGTPMRLAAAGLGAVVGRTVPAMAIEMTTIDVVKSALTEEGGQASAGILLAAGAAAGVVSNSVLHPLSKIASQINMPEVRLPGRTRALVPVVKSMSPTFRRSVPGAAANSFVRVGLVTQFITAQDNNKSNSSSSSMTATASDSAAAFAAPAVAAVAA